MKLLLPLLLISIISCSQVVRKDNATTVFTIEVIDNHKTLLFIKGSDTAVTDSMELIRYLLKHNEYMYKQCERYQEILDQAIQSMENAKGTLFYIPRKRKYFL